MREGYKRFYYKGPVIKMEKHIGNWTGFTEAPSQAKAINNFKFKIKRDLKLEVTAKINIDPKYIKQI